MWILYSLAASVLWALTYVLNDQIFRKISIATTLSVAMFFGFLATLALALVTKSAQADFRVLTASRETALLLLAATTTFVIADILGAMAIQSKNASLMSLIEISYPVFISLFAWLLFRESQLTVASAIGGAFILVGVAIVSVFGR